MVPGYTIRLSTSAELERVRKIEREAFKLFAGWESALGLDEAHPPESSSIDTLRDANADGRLWVAADAEGHPVGFALVREIGLYAHVEEIDVLPAHGRQGLGAALVEAVCEWAHTRGFDAVTVSTFRDVPWNAPFYARRGFLWVPSEDLPSELLEVVELERRKGLRVDLRVIMRREL